jgi:2-keto-4-pentenoate hydratase/2-oxohepta-3-ene-1,7-dioic acid hydratase in catechol pathway
MFLLMFRSGDGYRLGIKTPRGVLDVQAASLDPLITREAPLPASTQAVIGGGEAAMAALERLVETCLALQPNPAQTTPEWFLAEDTLTYGPCLPSPGKIICVGMNYRQHALETGGQVPETPILFSKFNNAVAAPGEPIPLPGNATEYDYEAELAVVIGQRARGVSEAAARGYVFGYCCANDVSARDLQFRTPQWLLGKTLDKFMPLGPYLVTADEVADPQALALRCWVNGDLRQNSNTADMVFAVNYLVSYISQYFTLDPGDLILTGTPGGVALGMAEKTWLKPGDEVVVEVGNLGRLSNPMTAG